MIDNLRGLKELLIQLDANTVVPSRDIYRYIDLLDEVIVFMKFIRSI